MYYIHSKNEMINPAHIIRAEYVPEHTEPEYIDTDGDFLLHPALNVSAKLSLWLTAIKLEQSYTYETVDGTASATDVYVLRDADAERLWTAMMRNSYAI